MGNYKSKLNQAKQIPFHPSLSEPYIYSKKNEKFMTVKVNLSKEQYDTWIKKRANFKQMIKNGRHLFWVKQSEFERIGIFGDQGYSVMRFPYCPVTLKDEIKNRSRSGVSFQQKELWYLFYSMISLAEQAHRYSETLGDIRPQNILLTDKGEINVITKLSLPTESKNIDKTLKSFMPTFLSPEQIEIIKSEPKKLVKCSSASQCFSIGLTLLMTSILRNGDELYLPPKTFQKDLLKQYIRQLDEQTTFDNSFKLFIKGLCQINPAKRFTAEEVCQCLQNYQRQIYSLTSFQLQHLPPKLLKKLNINQNKSSTSIQNIPNTAQSQKILYKNFQKTNQNKQPDQIKETQFIKPHYFSLKLIQKIKENIKVKEQKLGLQVGTLPLESIQIQTFKQILQEDFKKSNLSPVKQNTLEWSDQIFTKKHINENNKTQEQHFFMNIPKLRTSPQNQQVQKLNTIPKIKKVVRWENDQITKLPSSNQKLNEITSNETLKKINQLKQNTNPNIFQASICQKISKKETYPLTLSTLNSFEFFSSYQSPHKQGLFDSQILQDKDFEKLQNLSESNCSMEKN